jgi:hypothetical protein
LDELFLRSASDAVEVIKWFNNHSVPLGMLRRQQLINGATQPLALILAVITRWTTHYLSMQRLLQVSKPLRNLVINDTEALLDYAGRDEKARERTEKIIAIINDARFWENLTRSVFLLFSNLR